MGAVLSWPCTLPQTSYRALCMPHNTQPSAPYKHATNATPHSPPSPSTTNTHQLHTFHPIKMLELLFVGAGPHSMATLARLIEPHPDPGVDAPQRFVVAKSKVLSYWQWQRTCPTYRAAVTDWLQAHVAVVDPSGSWMSRWQQQFTALGISHLRSTTAVHPDPLDSYALQTYAEATGRSCELMPLQHIEKSREFSGPFAVPSSRLFGDFCDDLVQRYCLDAVLVKDKVIKLTPVVVEGSDTPDHWVVELASGKRLEARRVLLGIGSTNKARLPEALQHLQPLPVLQPSSPAPSAAASNGSSSEPVAAATPSSNSSSSGGGGATTAAVEAAVPGQPSPLKALPSTASGSAASLAPVGSVSECCTSASGCDGACSNSSGWSTDSCVAAGAAAECSGKAALANNNSGSVSSPRSDCDSLCSWLDLGAEQEAGLDTPSNSSSSAEPAQAYNSLAVSVPSCDAPDLAAAAEPGPCNWVASAASSPTGSAAACDSLCSWLGCEHTAAQLQKQKQQGVGSKQHEGAQPERSHDSSSSSWHPASAAADGSAGDPAAAGSCYPWGRLMHAWQLVDALSGAADTKHTDSEDKPTHTAHTTTTTSRKSRLSSCSSGSSRRSKSLHSSKKNSRSATQSAALLLQQRGLAAPGESVVIVGGGLTSAHLAALAAAATAPQGGDATGGAVASDAAASLAGCQQDGSSSDSARVSLLLRGPQLRVKQFDVDIEFMGRNRGSTLQFAFKSLSRMEDRLKLMKRVLQGGSVTPEAAGMLLELQGQPGVLRVREDTEVVDASWDWEQQRWDIWLQDGSVLNADRLWMATGSALSAAAEPLLASLLQELPIPLVAGLPAVQPSLEWAAGSGLFVLGAYAALQLGPGALNLAGAKTGSVAVAQHLKGQLPPLPAAAVAAGWSVVRGSSAGSGVVAAATHKAMGCGGQAGVKAAAADL